MAEKGCKTGVAALMRLRTGDVTEGAREMHTATQAQANLQQNLMEETVAWVLRARMQWTLGAYEAAM